MSGCAPLLLKRVCVALLLSLLRCLAISQSFAQRYATLCVCVCECCACVMVFSLVSSSPRTSVSYISRCPRPRTTTSPTTSSASCPLRRLYERKVCLELLLHQCHLSLAARLDGLARLVLMLVFEESVPLRDGGESERSAATITTSSRSGSRTHLDISSTTIEIQMTILDVAKVKELVREVLLCSFFVDVGHDEDPPLDCCEREPRGQAYRSAPSSFFAVLAPRSRSILTPRRSSLSSTRTRCPLGSTITITLLEPVKVLVPYAVRLHHRIVICVASGRA